MPSALTVVSIFFKSQKWINDEDKIKTYFLLESIEILWRATRENEGKGAEKKQSIILLLRWSWGHKWLCCIEVMLGYNKGDVWLAKVHHGGGRTEEWGSWILP